MARFLVAGRAVDPFEFAIPANGVVMTTLGNLVVGSPELGFMVHVRAVLKLLLAALAVVSFATPATSKSCLAISMSVTCPAVASPCGHDEYGGECSAVGCAKQCASSTLIARPDKLPPRSSSEAFHSIETGPLSSSDVRPDPPPPRSG